ncbi:hypothetical protein [Tenacibaculum sp. 190524A02b]|uniref:hypothetical protein n=1 Tax=Tenacibaculum vairaonense TaxID=3137860 RepID=UPI0031FA55C7
MTTKLTKTSVFTEEDLKHLPLTYRKMEVEETKNIGELYVGSMYSRSDKHFSKKYMIFNSHKPISNFLIDDETI